ncbi:MAG TPA: hypothetical protein VNE42_09475 [Acidimicrobiales bacterium]|nr:hypothetical protein [Acidimicrobiales bacterium]
MSARRHDTIRKCWHLELCKVVLPALLIGGIVTTSQVQALASPLGGGPVAVCPVHALQVSVVFNGFGNPYGAITFVNNGTRSCSLSGRPTIRVFDRSGSQSAFTESTDQLSPPLGRPRDPAVLSPAAPWAIVEMDWCATKSNFRYIGNDRSIDIRFQGWAHPLTILASSFDPKEFFPPVCSNPSKRVLAVDFVRAMGPYGNIAGSTPAIHVTPSSNLYNGEKVIVHVSGLDIGWKFWVYECAASADVNPGGCGLGPPQQQFGLTDMSGNGSFTFIVKSMAPIKFNDTVDLLPCRDQCVMMATIGGGSYFIPPQSSLKFSRT